MFNKVEDCSHALKKETPTQVFFYEICEIFKNIYFEEHLQTTASSRIVLKNVTEATL